MMTSRRSFIKSTSLLSMGAILSPSFYQHNKKYIGLQLYTVRESMQSDPAGTLAKIARIGYNSLEGATYTGTEKFYGMEPAAFAKLIKENNLIMPSSHYRLGEEKINAETVKGTILSNWQKAVDDAATVGLKYMTLSSLALTERGDLDHYKRIADHLNKAGETCKKSGIQLCYHNHNYEFIEQNGKLPYDILLSSEKDLVKMEIDLYWIAKAGKDPIAFFNKHPGRFPLWHVKDMDNTADRAFTEVGNGTIDFRKLFSHAKKSGLAYFLSSRTKLLVLLLTVS